MKLRSWIGVSILVFGISSVSLSRAQECVNIYFDRSSDSKYWMGKTYSMFLQNLMGHFPQYQQIISPIELYKKGDIEKCRASIYIGSYFDNKIPKAFLSDYVSTQKNVAWLGYSIWQLKKSFAQIFGFKYAHFTVLDKKHLDSEKKPTFFKNIHYKGETFYKYGDWSKKGPKTFLAPFEQTILKPVDKSKSQILAVAEHNGNHDVIPYILRAKNHFYVADVPFSFMHEADRYLVFADVLFDILNEQPRHNGKYAFVRVEDVHALVPLSNLYQMTNAIHEENVPINISIIPIFFDPLDHFGRIVGEDAMIPADRSVEFVHFLNDMKKLNANFIWHGVTHQYKDIPNPYEGISGADFEFFDVVRNEPLKEDSVDYVLGKMQDGQAVLDRVGIKPNMWLTPHYQASSLDYVIFANTFAWNVGRIIYYNHSFSGLNEGILNRGKNGDDPNLYFSSSSADSIALRKRYFANLKTNVTFDRWNGQFYPYEIYGDIDGQRILPENLGNSQPYVGEYISNPRTKEDIVQTAKRNLVLRDVWASFFYHPFLLNSYDQDGRGKYPGDPAELKYILENLKQMGYQFIDLKEYTAKNTITKRPEPIYKE